MNLKSAAFVQKAFREYYTKDLSLDESFPLIEKREFGFTSFEGWMLRHKSFKNNGELEAFLKNSVPSDAYFSCAYYEDPVAEMEKKGWLGADLIFDIDADHIPTSCTKIHDTWSCGGCGFGGKGTVPEECPSCKSQKFSVNTWPCEECLDCAKAETVKLLDMLVQDFGFPSDGIRVFFSGHRGYHIHVEDRTVQNLDGLARKEIVDYISGLGFDATFHGFGEKGWKKSHVLRGPKLDDFGWRGRIAKGIYDFIQNAEEEDYKHIALSKNAIKIITENKDLLLKSWEKEGPWTIVKGIAFETWKKIAEYCAQLKSAKIDTVVTTDVHRLIRLTNTLHGKTGLRKVELSSSAIEDFDPFKEAVAFKTGTATVYASDAPRFRLGDETFGPYKNQKVDLPLAVALLLVCKRRAKVST